VSAYTGPVREYLAYCKWAGAWDDPARRGCNPGEGDPGGVPRTDRDIREDTMSTTDQAHYVHKERDGLVLWDLSGGFCLRCHAEGRFDVTMANPGPFRVLPSDYWKDRAEVAEARLAEVRDACRSIPSPIANRILAIIDGEEEEEEEAK